MSLDATVVGATVAAPPPASDMRDIDLIHGISVALIGEQDSRALYGRIVDAAVAITRSQFGTMQLVCPPGDPSGHDGELNLLAHRGLPPEAVAFWEWVNPAAHSSCTAALKRSARAIIPDFEEWDEIAGTEDLAAFRRTGIRSAQTTPLVSRQGELLGMISTHWDAPHIPSERDLRLLDILARQAADLLERTIAEEALRAREQALQESESLQKLLTGELSHRVKNMLATVQAIATQTQRHSKNSAEFVTSFSGRIQSMSRVHAQLSTNEWKGTLLSDIVGDQMKLGAADETRISTSGPAVSLTAEAVPMMAMMLHELGTNSIKYGALSRPSGTVAIDWVLAGDMLELRWSERGGPAVKAPVRRGFGSALIEQSATSAGGAAAMTIGADGVHWDISIPCVEPVTPLRAATRVRAPEEAPLSLVEDAGRAVRALEGKRILIVEDEPLVAMDIADHLEREGAEIIGPVGTVPAALNAIDGETFDAAFLDANLRGVKVDEIAAALTRRNIPFAFVSGYDRSALPQSFAAVEVLAKPFNVGKLLALAAALVSQPCARLRAAESVQSAN